MLEGLTKEELGVFLLIFGAACWAWKRLEAIWVRIAHIEKHYAEITKVEKLINECHGRQKLENLENNIQRHEEDLHAHSKK